MATMNKFAAFCVSCLKQVEAGHGGLTKSQSGAWVVRCGTATNGRIPETRVVRSAGRPATKRGTRTGCSCGSVEQYSKASDCFSCRHDAE